MMPPLMSVSRWLQFRGLGLKVQTGREALDPLFLLKGKVLHIDRVKRHERWREALAVTNEAE